MFDLIKNVRFHKKMCDFTKKCAISQKNVRFDRFFINFKLDFSLLINISLRRCFEFKNSLLKNFQELCVCVEKNVRGDYKIDKTFSAKKNVRKKFLAEKKSEIFFTNFKIKKNFKFLENYFLDFSFSKKQ